MQGPSSHGHFSNLHGDWDSAMLRARGVSPKRARPSAAGANAPPFGKQNQSGQLVPCEEKERGGVGGGHMEAEYLTAA